MIRMCLPQKWEEVISIVFKNTIPRKYLKILCGNLMLVNIGLKPSYLWDLPVQIDRSKIQLLTITLKQNKLMFEHIITLTLGDDLFISNTCEINRLFLNLPKLFKFIDCSSDLKSAQLIRNNDDIYNMIQVVMENINRNKLEDYHSFKEEPQWCLPCLFGFLLGYPVVYWTSSCDTNLSHQPLVLYKISYISKDVKLQELYSFTVPRDVAVTSHVEDWKMELCNRFSVDLNMTETIVMFPLGHLREAAHYFRQALDINPNYLPAYRNLQSVCNSLVERWHFRMLNDSHRNEAYREAILKKVRQGFDSILDIGTGTGILSLYAVTSCAKDIHACDYSATMYSIAQEVLEANNMADKVTLINKLSNDLVIPKDLPHRKSLVVTETLDSGLLGEQLLQTLIHAWDRLLRPACPHLTNVLTSDTLPPVGHGVVLPLSATLWTCPVQSTALARRSYLTHNNQCLWSLSKLGLYRGSSEPYDTENLRNMRVCKFLQEPQTVFSFDFNNPSQLKAFYNGDFDGKFVSFVNEDKADALAVWFDVKLDEDITISSSPFSEDKQCCWDQAVFSFKRPMEKVRVKAGCAGGKLSFDVDSTICSGDISKNRADLLSEIAVSADCISFINNKELQEILYSLPNHFSNVNRVLDLSPFPMLGFSFLKHKGTNLYCVLKTEEEVKAVKNFVNENCLDMSRVKCLLQNEVEDFLFDSNEQFDLIANNLFLETGELSENSIAIIPKLTRLLAPGGVLSPVQLSVVLQLLDCDWVPQTAIVVNPELTQTYRIAEFINVYQVSQQLDVDLQHTPYTPVSDTTVCLQLHTPDLAAPVCRAEQVSVSVTHEGRLTAIAVWFQYRLCDTVPTLSTFTEDSHVKQMIFVVEPSLSVKPGDSINVDVTYLCGLLRLKVLP